MGNDRHRWWYNSRDSMALREIYLKVAGTRCGYKLLRVMDKVRCLVKSAES